MPKNLEFGTPFFLHYNKINIIRWSCLLAYSFCGHQLIIMLIHWDTLNSVGYDSNTTLIWHIKLIQLGKETLCNGSCVRLKKYSLRLTKDDMT